MKPATEILNYVLNLMREDQNVLAITLQHDIKVHTLGGTTETAPNVIEIIFEDINESEWYDSLNTFLRDYLQDQPFKVIFGDGDTMLVFLKEG